ncbi:MAG: Xaa-Pro aminopeptidase [Bacteroides sp. SM1_62]|nr:MAG: Xaa-Pro aminopeptidase [Bacteroides sp. SM1_62]
MFKAEVYSNRRDQLRRQVSGGVALFPANNDSPMNYPDNTYHYRQDSSFLYFFGLDQPGLAGVIDFESGKDYLFGDDLSLDDIIWMGSLPSMKSLGEKAGISRVLPYHKLSAYLEDFLQKGRFIHYLPPYRDETLLEIARLTNMPWENVKSGASLALIKGVIGLRSVKEAVEVEDIIRAVDTSYEMHTTVMKMARPGIYEREIAGRIEGIALSHGTMAAFPIILSMDGQTLHNHYHGNILEEGRLIVTDAGAETVNHYAGDITRTVPVDGKFSQRQKEIYEIVLKAEVFSIDQIRPGTPYRDIHRDAARIIAAGLRDLGLMKGDVEEAVNAGAHAMFFPHGLGHMLGLDVHDMEGLGENLVGYSEEIRRSDQFGTAYLRLGKELESGYVITVEPGIYFIPALIDRWRSEGKFTAFIDYEKVESYKDFGGIRIEDDILVTDKGSQVLGKPIPKTVQEVEDMMRS